MKPKKDLITGMPKSEKISNFSKCDLEDKDSVHNQVSKNSAQGDVYPKK